MRTTIYEPTPDRVTDLTDLTDSATPFVAVEITDAMGGSVVLYLHSVEEVDALREQIREARRMLQHHADQIGAVR